MNSKIIYLLFIVSLLFISLVSTNSNLDSIINDNNSTINNNNSTIVITPAPSNNSSNSTSPTPTQSLPFNPFEIPSFNPTPTPTTFETPTPTTPYQDGKMRLIINVYSNINYTVGSQCGQPGQPCKTIYDAIKSYTDFKKQNQGIEITLLELYMLRGFYMKSSFEEVATNINLYDLNVNVSYVGENYGEVIVQGNSSNPFITIRSKENEVVSNRTFEFHNLTFENWNENEIFIIDTLNEKESPLQTKSSSESLPMTAQQQKQQQQKDNSTNGVVRVKLSNIEIRQTNSVKQLLVAKGTINTLEVVLEKVSIIYTNSINHIYVKGVILKFDKFGSNFLRTASAFVHSENSIVIAENSLFNCITSISGAFYSVNSTLQITNSQFSSNIGNFVSCINYVSQEQRLNVTDCHFDSNIVINSGDNGGSSIIMLKKYVFLPNGINEDPSVQLKASSNPKKRADSVKKASNKCLISNCVFQNNGTPKNKNSGLIYGFNVPVYMDKCKFFTNAQNDHGPNIISRYASFELENCTIIDRKSEATSVMAIDALYSSFKLSSTLVQPLDMPHVFCENSVFELDYRTDINVSQFVCNNIHDAKYNQTYVNVDAMKLNSYYCEILQVEDDGSRSTNFNEICTNNPRSKYHYEIKLTKAIIAIIVILCAFLTIIPIFILANKIYKTLYKGYRPHTDIEEFNIHHTPEGDYSDDSDDNSNSTTTTNNQNSNNNNNNYQKSKLINQHQQNNDGFHEVLYDEEIPSNKSLLSGHSIN